MKLNNQFPVFSYMPPNWKENEFLDYGGFVAVVLNYNKRGMIADAVKSACMQDYPVYEVLILDDASTDGSEQEAIVAAKECINGGCDVPIRVFVNETNSSITGQWQLAVSVSNGSWFGMFCGDDISLSNRISQVAKRLSAYPSAWGICTNVTSSSNGHWDEGGQHNGLMDSDENVIWSGTDDGFPNCHFYGCSAFWHRNVFDNELPRLNLDDLFLCWTVFARRSGTVGAALLYAWDLNTVNYRVGSGITTEHSFKAIKEENKLVKYWYNYSSDYIHFKKFAWVWRHIREYCQNHGGGGKIVNYALGCSRLAELRASSWSKRISCYWRMAVTERNNDYGGSRCNIMKTVNRHMLLYAAGPVVYVCMYVCLRCIDMVKSKLRGI